MIKIWHNPKCSKSRASLEVIEQSGKEYEVIKYLDIDITVTLVQDILNKLDISALELMRTKEDLYLELNVKDVLEEIELIKIMSEYPKLIERPIIVKGDKAVIGRPIENTINLIKV